MWEAIVWALSQSIKVLGIVGAWMLFKMIVGHGSQTIRDLLETVEMGIQAVCFKLKMKFYRKIRNEEDPEQTGAEGSVV